MNYLRSIYASAYSATVSIVITVILTLATEFSALFKEWLKSFTDHHWVTKSWVSILSFVLFYFVFRFLNKAPDSQKTQKSLVVLEWALILGFIIILGFFVYEFF